MSLQPRLPVGLYGMIDLPARHGAPATGPRPTSGPGPAAQGLAASLIEGGARVLQLRMKGSSAAEVLGALDALRPILRQRPDVLLIVNDRLDVALSGGAHGVHLGQDDVPLLQARRICPPGFLVGISTHNEAQAEAAIAGGADYVALGPIYATSSKANPDPVVGVERLAALCRRSPVPVVAIGGITLERLPEVVRAGAHAAAIIAAVNHAPDVTAAANQVTQRFAQR